MGLGRVSKTADVLVDALADIRRAGGDPSRMLDVVRRLSQPAAIEGIISTLLSDQACLSQVASSSVRHANGFDKIVLAKAEEGPQLRFHIWEPPSASVPRSIENAHNHRWCFATSVLVGGYTATTFAPRDGDEYRRRTYTPTDVPRGYVMSGEESTGLEPASITTYRAGSAYWISHSTVHRVSPADPASVTATLLAVGRRLTPITSVFVPRDPTIPAVGGRPHQKITPDELHLSLEALRALVSVRSPQARAET